MSNTATDARIVSMRAELLAEILLRELKPEFLANSKGSTPYDLFIGFKTHDGGLNTFAVEVKATENVVRNPYRLQLGAKMLETLLRANIKVLLLVINVRNNKCYFTWSDKISVPEENVRARSKSLELELIEVTEATKKQLYDEVRLPMK
ncbi:MAG: hypothetical protein ACAI35_22730 [Candidatus Methylacidiphilales bacterium]|nr:hypothetical protein [Candidatus Methylacidiphilales bacterium]